MFEGDPENLFNHDIVMIHDMINRFIEELADSQSSPVSGLIIHDVDRLKSYTSSLVALHDWVVSQPILDLPKTHPREYKLEAAPEPANVESEAVNMLVRLMEALRTEMINSQSARLASTLMPDDSRRFLTIVEKIDSFVDDYVLEATPLDLPESSPREAMSGKGRKGTKGSK